MIGIKNNYNIYNAKNSKNFDAFSKIIEKEKAVFTIADGSEHKGLLSDKWSQYLCDNSPLEAITTKKGLKFFINDIWEKFYDENSKKIKDSFQRNKYEKQGSFSTYTACWLSQEKNKIYYQWLSFGNSTVLIYDSKNDELFVPKYKNSLLGFLKNKGQINWKEDDLKEEYLITGSKKELKKDFKIILASDAIAEHLALSYLIIKSKNDDYWKILRSIMRSDKLLSDLIFNNRGTFTYNSFDEILDRWHNEEKNNTVSSFIEHLQKMGQLAKDDVAMQVISYDPKGVEFTTQKKPNVVKPKPAAKKSIPYKVPLPKVKKRSEFKINKDKFIDILLDNGIKKLYHFTDRSNLAMIKKLGGLYSWEYMEQNNIKIPMAGGDNLSRMLDARHGLGNYVRTSFCSNHPMIYIARKERRILDPVLLEIDPIVVTLYDTVFSDMNATRNGHLKGKRLGDLERIDFGVCVQKNHFDLEEHEKPYYQAEVMVKQFLPSKYIMNLNKF